MRRIFVLAALLGFPAPLVSQSLLYRSPNLGGTWVADAGVVQFNFLHRFSVGPAPLRNVTNQPTFTVAAGLGRRMMVGWHFGTKSLTVPFPTAKTQNESEFFARWRVMGNGDGHDGFALALTPAYNHHADSFDGELGADYTFRQLTLLGAFRAMSKPFGASGGASSALAGGAIVRLNDYIALSGDYAKLLSGDSTAAWSAGLSVAIPGTPHTLSLQVSNVTVNTIQGSSRGFTSPTVKRFYGFEFTIPLHMSRFSQLFKRSGRAAALVAEPGVAVIEIRAFKFPDILTIQAGQTVRWVNSDPVEHTITIESGDVASPLIRQGATFSYKFDRPGTYTYHCTPHPFMKGTIVVR